MVGVNSYTHRFGTVAIFATLFAAIHVTFGEKGCIFDFENVSDFDLECNNEKNSWTANEDAKYSPNKKILILSPEEEGCLKTKHTITLNATSPVTIRFYGNGASDESGKLALRLLPKEGSCPDEECVWNIGSDPQFKQGEWVTAGYKFPLKSMKEYYVQLQVGKSKGKFFVENIVFPSAIGDSFRCRAPSASVRSAKVNILNKFVEVEGEASSTGGAGGATAATTAHAAPAPATNATVKPSTSSQTLIEFSKNLMLTSASVLTLNNILN